MRKFVIAAGVGLLLEQPWWIAAIAGSVFSFSAIVPWWKAVVPGAYLRAAFDVFTVILFASPLKELLPGLQP